MAARSGKAPAGSPPAGLSRQDRSPEGAPVGWGRPAALVVEDEAEARPPPEHRGQALSRQQILDRLRGGDYFGDERLVDSHVKNLREKLEPYGLRDVVATVWGVGYRFEG